jgi:hypothetical protein
VLFARFFFALSDVAINVTSHLPRSVGVGSVVAVVAVVAAWVYVALVFVASETSFIDVLSSFISLLIAKCCCGFVAERIPQSLEKVDDLVYFVTYFGFEVDCCCSFDNLSIELLVCSA